MHNAHIFGELESFEENLNLTGEKGMGQRNWVSYFLRCTFLELYLFVIEFWSLGLYLFFQGWLVLFVLCSVLKTVCHSYSSILCVKCFYSAKFTLFCANSRRKQIYSLLIYPINPGLINKKIWLCLVFSFSSINNIQKWAARLKMSSSTIENKSSCWKYLSSWIAENEHKHMCDKFLELCCRSLKLLLAKLLLARLEFKSSLLQDLFACYSL